MKQFYLAGLSLVLIFGFQELSAQNLAEFSQEKAEKAKLFDRIPSKFSIYTSALDKLFLSKVNSKIVLPVDGTNFFEGTISEKVQRNDQVVSINIKSSNFDGAMLTLSRISRPGQPVSYSGRLMSINHGDAFVLLTHGDETLFLKQRQSSLVVE
jgi:hypothetical protein